MVLADKLGELLGPPPAGNDLVGFTHLQQIDESRWRGWQSSLWFFKVVHIAALVISGFGLGHKNGQAPYGTHRSWLPLLPSGPGGVHLSDVA